LEADPWSDELSGPCLLTEGMRRYQGWLDGLRDADGLEAALFVECPLPHPTFFASRALFAKYGYRDCGWPEDYDLLLRLSAAGLRLGVVPTPLLLWRDGPGRLSRTGSAYHQRAFVACKAWHLSERYLSKGRAFLLWGHGDTGRALRAALAGLGWRPRAILEVSPRKVGQRIDGVPVLSPDVLRERCADFIVVSVAGTGPRREIEARLSRWGYVAGRDFVFAA